MDSQIDKPTRRPPCPNCKAELGRDVEMTGPIKHPSGSIPGLFFVCERCNFMMKDRRREQRDPGSR